LEPCLCLAVAADRCRLVVARRHQLLEAPELYLQLNQIGGPGQDVVPERQPSLERRPLVVERDPDALLEGEVAALEARLADEGPQQGRLPGAVRPGKGDAVPPLDLERHPVEERVAGKLLAEIGCDYDCHRLEASREPRATCIP